ncbi:uncharacterized protein K02A2.6-like [Rhipicephalus sanguineus]|uniref:uncharacterized protein K02A2.6-like n=1 Tax=Rhipicephalus sanguineus TaxID=34632 RepID=UPI001895C6C6|nr:uncharacterized protein K02A2.6-like [Rhipicephalus sanguineus]
MTARCNGKDMQGTVVVVDSLGPSLCGRDTIKAVNEIGVPMLTNVVASVQPIKFNGPNTGLDALLGEYADVFARGLGLCKGPLVTFQLQENVAPRFFKARTVPYALRDKMSDALDQLVAQDVLTPVKTAEWATPVVPVLKKEGSLRICGDFRMTINAATATEQYPLPRVQDIFAKLNGGEVFTTLDLRQAYNQLPLDEHAQKIAVLNTQKGLFCFKRLPFGVSSASAVFQRRMDALLSDIPGVQVYLDDIIVAEKRSDMSRLRKDLQRLREYGVRLHKEKCKFRQAEVTFLGHRIDAKGLRPKDESIKAVREAPRAHLVSELKAFLGLVNYYGKFLPSLATVLAPLYALLAKGAKWQCEKEHKESFRKVKEAMEDSQFLAHFDPEMPLRLECDASPVGIGAVLSHRVNGVAYPIGVRSRKLTRAECNYSQLEKEALALVFVVARFKDYLYGHQFVLVTGQKPLTGLLNPKKAIPPMAAARIQRWALFLAKYSYTVQYRKGSDHSKADALSRLPLPASDPREGHSDEREYVLFAQAMEETAICAREVKQMTDRDTTLQQVKERILAGWPLFRPQNHKQYRPYFNRRMELTASAMPPVQVPATWPATGEGWSHLQADFAGPVDGHMVLVIVDSETKWIEAVLMKIATSETTVRALRSIFARFGLPKTFVSDNGPHFVSGFFREFLARNKVQQLTTVPYHPQSNGYRRTPGQDGKSPAERLLGYQIRTKIDNIKPKEKYADGLPAEATRKFNAGEPVWERTFGRSRRWIPGVVHDQKGSRMVTVDCAQGRHRRHLDQLRRRAESVDSDLGQKNKQEPAEETGENVQDSPEETAAESPPPLVRRSTRPRKPP